MNVISHHQAGDKLILKFLQNELVFNNISFILENVEKALLNTQAKKVVFDFSNVFVIDSSAVGMLLTMQNTLKTEGKELIIHGLNDNVKRVLKLLDIFTFLDVA